VSRITDEERNRRAQSLFETHQERQLQALFPSNSIVETSTDNSLLCWSENTQVVRHLRDLLPFGRILGPIRFSEFINNTLSLIVKASQEQLLYWHLAGTTTRNNYPEESLLLWNSDDHFWFTVIPIYENILVEQILRGERLQYLERFRLDHQEIQFAFYDLRLASQASHQNRLVTTEGREIVYKWRTQEWETTTTNPDQRLINPRIYYFPPDHPSSRNQEYANPRIQVNAEELSEILQEISEEGLASQREEELPPSSPPSDVPNQSTPSSRSGWDLDNPLWNRQHSCWCEGKEICTCGFRPDTPPTPPSVVLWAPGYQYLPSSE